MDQVKPVVLLTGFGPFPGVEVNASAVLVAEIARLAAERLPDAVVHHYAVATEWTTAPPAVCDLIARHRPAVALMFGVSSTAQGLQLETQARNVCALTPDAAGCVAAGTKLHEHGDECLAATWPIDAIGTRLTKLRVPWSMSADAGSYICNATLYEVLASAALGWGTAPVTGFVHIPRDLLEHTHGSALTLISAAEASIGIIDVCLSAASKVVHPQQTLTV